MIKPSRLLLPAIALGATACGTKEAPAPKPNVLLIVADDLGLGDVSCYGSTTINTPSIDGLAADGLLMRHAYATSSTSTPSRFALFTESPKNHLAGICGVVFL